MSTPNCDLCGDSPRELFLQARCHPSAPLRAVKNGNTLILRCYIPECNRVVAELALSTDLKSQIDDIIGDYVNALNSIQMAELRDKIIRALGV